LLSLDRVIPGGCYVLKGSVVVEDHTHHVGPVVSRGLLQRWIIVRAKPGAGEKENARRGMQIWQAKS